MDINIPDFIKNSAASICKLDLTILMTILEKLKPKNILEIGAWKGYSAEVWLSLTPEKLITIEINHQFEDASIHPEIKYLWDHDSTKIETFQEVEREMPVVDFLFIDADHNYNLVLKDWQMYSKLVRPGGIIAFHDVNYVAENVTVKPLWDELKTKHNYIEIKTEQHSTGIGVIFV